MSTSHRARFTNESEIIEVIDRYNKDITELLLNAEGTDKIADSLRNTSNAYRIPTMRQMSEKLRRRVDWRRKQIVLLGDRLAEIRTPPLPAVEIDETVEGL